MFSKNKARKENIYSPKKSTKSREYDEVIESCVKLSDSDSDDNFDVMKELKEDERCFSGLKYDFCLAEGYAFEEEIKENLQTQPIIM